MTDGIDLRFATAEDAIRTQDTRLVDVVDRLLDHGVVLRGELWLSVVDVDLVYVGLDLVLTNPDSLARPQVPA